MTNKSVQESYWEKEYTKENGIEMNLFVDLMIANKGDKAIVKKKLDELRNFISNLLKQQKSEIKEELLEKMPKENEYSENKEMLGLQNHTFEMTNDGRNQALSDCKKVIEKILKD